MKFSKSQLRRIIKEEQARILQEMTPDVESPERIAADLKLKVNRGVATVEEGGAPDELYIMVGDALGFTVKVLRRGR